MIVPPQDEYEVEISIPSKVYNLVVRRDENGNRIDYTYCSYNDSEWISWESPYVDGVIYTIWEPTLVVVCHEDGWEREISKSLSIIDKIFF